MPLHIRHIKITTIHKAPELFTMPGDSPANVAEKYLGFCFQLMPPLAKRRTWSKWPKRREPRLGRRAQNQPRGSSSTHYFVAHIYIYISAYLGYLALNLRRWTRKRPLQPRAIIREMAQTQQGIKGLNPGRGHKFTWEFFFIKKFKWLQHQQCTLEIMINYKNQSTETCLDQRKILLKTQKMPPPGWLDLSTYYYLLNSRWFSTLVHSFASSVAKYLPSKSFSQNHSPLYPHLLLSMVITTAVLDFGIVAVTATESLSRKRQLK